MRATLEVKEASGNEGRGEGWLTPGQVGDCEQSSEENSWAGNGGS